MEKQALQELEIFAKENSTCQNVDTLEDGEIFDSHEESSQAASSTTLDINSYIKRQEEFKKRQDYKRSLETNILKTKIINKVSKRNNDVITKNLLKRKLQSETTTKNKQKKITKHEVDNKDGSSGSEYIPSDGSGMLILELSLSHLLKTYFLDYEYEEIKVRKRSKQNTEHNIEKVRDDGCLELYNSRLKEYYSKIEANPEEILLEDVELNGGLKVPQKLWDNLYR